MGNAEKSGVEHFARMISSHKPRSHEEFLNHFTAMRRVRFSSDAIASKRLVSPSGNPEKMSTEQESETLNGCPVKRFVAEETFSDVI